MAFDLRFTKGHGTGNDFVLFSDPEGDVQLTPTQIAAVCDRHFGVGGDGLIRAVRSDRLVDGAAAICVGVSCTSPSGSLKSTKSLPVPWPLVKRRSNAIHSV